MTGGSLGLRTGSYGLLLQQQLQNGVYHTHATSLLVRKPTKTFLSGSREKERVLPFILRYSVRKRVSVLLLVVLALLVFILGTFTVSKERTSEDITQIGNTPPYEQNPTSDLQNRGLSRRGENDDDEFSTLKRVNLKDENRSQRPLSPHPCENFALPPPAPNVGKRIGPRPCPVCYAPVEQAIASMPSLPSESPVLHNLTYVRDENPTTNEPHRGSDFGGYPSLNQRNDSFDIKESMTVHCGFVRGSKPGQQSGFDIDEADLLELEKFNEVIVASAIFGNYDVIQHPKNICDASRETVPFFMFIDEETEAYMKNSSVLDGSKRVGLWRIIVVHNVPYADPRRNGKVPKLLLHRLLPNVRYSIWIDAKLQLVVDPYQILERFLWRQNATFAISRHYKRFDVFEEAEANKAAGKYDNSSIDEQIKFYVDEGLTPYSLAKLPLTSDVPEGCVLIREHIPITNLITCLWFNEVDRFTSRDQLSFSTVRDNLMARVDWSINMFLDCERRNFVIQAYHRELLEQMPPPPPPSPPRATHAIVRFPSTFRGGNIVLKTPFKRFPARRGKGDRKSSSRRHRKVITGSRDKNSF